MSTQAIQQKIAEYFKTQPVVKAWLFGSYSRGEERPDSDVDIMVQYEEGSRISLLTISHMMGALEKVTGHRIDLVEEGCLLPFAAESAERDKILIYERERNMETKKFKQVPSINRIGERNPNIPLPKIINYGTKSNKHERTITSPMHTNSRSIGVGEPINWNEVYS